jgi:hypothetical protein
VQRILAWAGVLAAIPVLVMLVQPAAVAATKAPEVVLVQSKSCVARCHYRCLRANNPARCENICIAKRC